MSSAIAALDAISTTSATSLSDTLSSPEERLLVSALAVAIALLATWFTRRAQARLKERMQPAVADVITSVIVVAVFAGTVGVIVDAWGMSNVVADELGGIDHQELIPRLVVTGIVAAGAHVVTGVIRRLLDDLLGSSRAVTEHQREVTYRLSQLLIWTIALITVLGVWELNLGGLLIGAGFLGIVVGMAARQTLGSLLAGFVLMFSRPFEIGDWVEIGQGQDSQEGIVTDIAMMNTRIQTFDGEYVMVPNDVISGQAITNRSRKGRLRVEITVGVDYESDLDRAMELARGAVEEVDDAMSVPTPQVVCKEFGDSAILLGVRFWIDNPSARRRIRSQTAAIRAIKATFDREGITIPFPQRTVGARDAAAESALDAGEDLPTAEGSPPGGDE